MIKYKNAFRSLTVSRSIRFGGLPNSPGCRPPPSGCRPPPRCRPPLWMQTTSPWIQTSWMQTPGQSPRMQISLRQIPLGSPPPLWTEGMTHACENITFPQLLLQAVTRHLSAPEQIRNVLNSFTTNIKPEYAPLRRAAFARSTLNFISTVH